MLILFSDMYKQNLLTKNENLINNTIKEFLLKLNYNLFPYRNYFK